MPQCSEKLRSLAGKAALLALAWLVVLAAGAFSQSDRPTHFFAERTFEIPFEMDAGRPIKQVLLHASNDGKSYKQVASAAPAS